MPLFEDLPDSYPDVDQPSCQLLGRTALVVQGLMGMLVMLSLVYKRHRETPKRPWRIWLFDVSKQVVGQLFVHGVNLLASDLVSNHTSSKNACVSYFLNILIDTTFGVALIYFTLHALTRLFTDKFQLKGFESGMYGEPPSLTYWGRQAALYVFTLTTMKAIVITILILFPGIYLIGEWLLSWTWTGDGDAVQVIFVMGIFPIMMNIIQFWLIDSIVKASTTGPLALDIEQGAYQDREPLFRAPEEDDDDARRGVDVPNIRHSRNSFSSLDSRALHSHDDLTEDTTEVATPDDHKSSTSSSKHVVESHEYPPSLSSSLSSNASYPNKVPREAKNLLKKTKRREPLTPTHVRMAREESSRNSSIAPPNIPRTPPSVPTVAPVRISQDRAEWADAWDDSNDWDKDSSHHKQHSLTTTGEWNSNFQTAS